MNVRADAGTSIRDRMPREIQSVLGGHGWDDEAARLLTVAIVALDVASSILEDLEGIDGKAMYWRRRVRALRREIAYGRPFGRRYFDPGANRHGQPMPDQKSW